MHSLQCSAERKRTVPGLIGLMSALAACVYLLVPAGVANADVATWHSGCNTKEDPANLQFLDMAIKVMSGGTLVETQKGAKATKHIADKHWESFAAMSSDSFYFFSSAPSKCINNTYWSANHAPFNDGSHARFWTDPTTTTNVRGNAHHDHYCGGTSDTVDHYNDPRDNLADFFVGFRGLAGSYWYSSSYTLGNTPKTWSKPCGYTVNDDGYIAHIQQNTDWVNVS